jgi:hypothetical protein
MGDGEGQEKVWRWSFIQRMDVSGAVPSRVTGDWRMPGTTGNWYSPSDYTECQECRHPAFRGSRCARCGSTVKLSGRRGRGNGNGRARLS